jgi:pimeloyl-ACP methyl ester carboxylesterase
MATFVLIPGGWCGGWTWKHVTPTIRQAGHEVYPITLTGMGERTHLARPDTNLDTHIEDVVNVLVYEELADVSLVGWSYGGLVMAGVADRVPERLGRLVYLDAAEPRDGQSNYDMAGPETRVEEEDLAQKHGGGWLVPPPDEKAFANPKEPGLYIPDAARRRWFVSKLAGQPIQTQSQPVRRRNPRVAAIPHVYFVCTEGRSAESLARKRESVRMKPDAKYLEIPANHLALVTCPEKVAAALLSLT